MNGYKVHIFLTSALVGGERSASRHECFIPKALFTLYGFDRTVKTRTATFFQWSEEEHGPFHITR